MATPSPQISFSDVNTELTLSSTAQISMNDTDVRALAGAEFATPGTAISKSDLRGKTKAVSSFAATISTNQQELNLATYATSVGWNGNSAATITISSGVYIFSNNTAVAGLTTGSFPGGLTIVNNGYIIGKGGAGGLHVSHGNSPLGKAGGPAISLGVNTTITNNASAFIAGGGGGGGTNATGGGGGAGGGAGGNDFGNRTGGAGGAVGQAGASGVSFNGAGLAGSGGGAGGGGAGAVPPPPFPRGGSGGGGGRILPGSGGAAGSINNGFFGGSGGSGNSAGAVAAGAASGGGGGGWAASGGTGGAGSGSAGGAAGKAIALNGFTATRSGAGTTYGAVS